MVFDPQYYYITQDEADTISGSLYNSIDAAFSTFSGSLDIDISDKAVVGHTHTGLAEKIIYLTAISGSEYTTGSGFNEVLWDNQIRMDSDYFSHTVSGSEITVISGGLYQLNYNINVENIYSNKVLTEFSVEVNDVIQDYSKSYAYSLSSTYPYSVANKRIFIELNDNDKIKVVNSNTIDINGPAVGYANWYDTDWLYRKPIVIDGDQVETASGGTIEFDDSSTSSAPSGASTKNWSHTISGNDNRLLVVTIAFENNSGLSVTSVTYNSVAMTPGDSDSVTSGFFQFGAVYYMLEADLPAAGTYTIQVNLSGSASSFAAGAMSFYGVDQAAPEDTSTETATGTAVISTPITTTSDNALIITAISDGNTYSHTPNSGQTEEYDVSANSLSYCAGWVIRSSPSSGEIQWTSSSSTNRLVHVLLSFAPAPAGGGSITDYPMYYTAAFTKAKSDGSDLLFADANGTKLDHEVEDWNVGGYTFRGWVRIPTLSGGVDTTIYVYYGNTDATDQSNPTGVWDDNFVGIWHLNENVLDSTQYDNDGSITGTVVDATGKIVGGQDFQGSDDYISVTHDTELQMTDAVTMEVWVNLADATNNQKIISKFDLTNGYILAVQTDALYPEILTPDGNHGFTSGSISDSTWTYLAITWEAGGNVIGYINNSQVNSVDGGPDNIGSHTDNLKIGGPAWTTGFFDVDGILDEVRLSNVARGSDYLFTSFNNQNSPGTFYSTGSEEQNYISIQISNESSITLRLLRDN